MTWAQRLKRVFNIDIAICQACGGAPRIIACIEDPVVIKKIPSLGPKMVHPCTTPLTHLDKHDPSVEVSPLPPCRAPPQVGLKSGKDGKTPT